MTSDQRENSRNKLILEPPNIFADRRKKEGALGPPRAQPQHCPEFCGQHPFGGDVLKIELLLLILNSTRQSVLYNTCGPPQAGIFALYVYGWWVVHQQHVGHVLFEFLWCKYR